MLIIEGATEGVALEGYSCERLAKEFPEARMRREYDMVQNPDDENRQTLGDSRGAFGAPALRGHFGSSRITSLAPSAIDCQHRAAQRASP